MAIQGTAMEHSGHSISRRRQRGGLGEGGGGEERGSEGRRDVERRSGEEDRGPPGVLRHGSCGLTANSKWSFPTTDSAALDDGLTDPLSPLIAQLHPPLQQIVHSITCNITVCDFLLSGSARIDRRSSQLITMTSTSTRELGAMRAASSLSCRSFVLTNE